MKQAVVLTALVTLTVLSGCLEGDSGEQATVFGAVAGQDLEPGYYQFTHRGGDLTLKVPADNYARLDLFNGDDERLGRIELGDGGFADQLSIDGAPGEYVLSLIELAVVRHGPESTAPDGEPADAQPEDYDPAEYVAELKITSGGRTVDSFVPLGLHVERHILVDRDFQTQGLTPGTPLVLVNGRGDSLSDSTTLELARTPVDLRLLVAGAATDLEIIGRGAGGIIFEARDSYDFPFAQLTSFSRMFYPENVVDNVLDLQIEAPSQEGPIILEAHSYSRYVPGEGAGSRVRSLEQPGEGVVFTYGQLPSAPTRIELSASANLLQIWTEDAVHSHGMEDECDGDTDCSDGSEGMTPIYAWVAVFGDMDQKIGSFRVESGQRLEIPIQSGGSYVVYPIEGPVTIGTDAAPRDFEMHPLETSVRELATTAPGSSSNYGSAAADINISGVPYRIQPTMTDGRGEDFLSDPFLFNGCSSEGTVRLLAGGETIAFAGEGLPNTFGAANTQLPADGLSYEQDGFDGNCGQIGLAVYTYHR